MVLRKSHREVGITSLTLRLIRPTPACLPMFLAEFLKVMQKLEFLGQLTPEFHLRLLYSGCMRRATFLDAFNCGHRPLCAKRAHATPASRRVVCIGRSSKQASEFVFGFLYGRVIIT